MTSYTLKTVVYDKGSLPVTIELDVDWNSLARHLAAKAYRNKSGRSRLAIGITAKIKRTAK